jgi:hypothetical protein
MPNADIALAKKRLAGDLMILVIIQAVAVCILWLLWNDVKNDIYAASISVGLCVFIVTALWDSYRLVNVVFIPVWLRIYGGSVGFFSFFALTCLFGFFIDDFPVTEETFRLFVAYLFPFYVILPQFFISRWLAKAAEEGIM